MVPDFRRHQCRRHRQGHGYEGIYVRLRITGFEVAAFGDGGNDVAMLSAAGVGIAMGNACDEALNAADYVTATVDDDGIARALEHLGILDD